MEVTSKVAATTGKEAFKAAPANARAGRGIPDIPQMYSIQCCCTRKKTIVFCRCCGYFTNGRIRLQCSIHTNVTFLLDIAECPKCHSKSFLDEYIGPK